MIPEHSEQVFWQGTPDPWVNQTWPGQSVSIGRWWCRRRCSACVLVCLCACVLDLVNWCQLVDGDAGAGAVRRSTCLRFLPLMRRGCDRPACVSSATDLPPACVLVLVWLCACACASVLVICHCCLCACVSSSTDLPLACVLVCLVACVLVWALLLICHRLLWAVLEDTHDWWHGRWHQRRGGMPILTLGQGGMINMDRLLRNCVSEQVRIVCHPEHVIGSHKCTLGWCWRGGFCQYWFSLVLSEGWPDHPLLLKLGLWWKDVQ